MDFQCGKRLKWDDYSRPGTGDQPGQQRDPGSQTAINGSDLKRHAGQKQGSCADESRRWEVTCGVRVWARLVLSPQV